MNTNRRKQLEEERRLIRSQIKELEYRAQTLFPSWEKSQILLLIDADQARIDEITKELREDNE